MTTSTFTEDSLARSGVYPQILGVAGNAGYTLLNGHRTQWNNMLFGGPSSEVIEVGLILRGVHLSPDEEFKPTGVSFHLDNLEAWVGESGFVLEVFEWAEPPASGPRYRIESRSIPQRLSKTGSGVSVALRHALGVAGDRLTDLSLTQRFDWRLDTPAAVTTEQAIELASDVQDLISLDTGRPCAWTSIKLWSPGLTDSAGGGERETPVDLFAEWSVAPGAKAVRAHELLFSFADQGGIDGVRRWMEVAAKHREALGRVMATTYRPGLVSDRLLNCAAALESFDRRSSPSHRKRAKLEVRLRRCSELAGSPFKEFIGDVEGWVKTVRAARDDVAHHLRRPGRASASDSHYLWQSLYLCFTLCMLRSAGQGDVLIEECATAGTTAGFARTYEP